MDITITLSSLAGGGEAQFTLGQYFFSIGAYQDALSYFERASKVDSPNNGWSQAKYQLGVMYYDGLGVQEDMVRLFFVYLHSMFM